MEEEGEEDEDPNEKEVDGDIVSLSEEDLEFMSSLFEYQADILRKRLTVNKDYQCYCHSGGGGAGGQDRLLPSKVVDIVRISQHEIEWCLRDAYAKRSTPSEQKSPSPQQPRRRTVEELLEIYLHNFPNIIAPMTKIANVDTYFDTGYYHPFSCRCDMTEENSRLGCKKMFIIKFVNK